MRNLLAKLLILVVTLPLLMAADKEGGIIGTGVVGQITGLGQFEVSGMQFKLENDIPIEGFESVQDLEMGMTLAVRASRRGDEWWATHIRRVQVMVGPVTSSSEVMGVPIIGELPDAERVSIDGFWSEAGIVATRIEVAREKEDSVTGPVDQLKRAFELVGSPSEFPEIDGDGIITLKGSYIGGKFVIQSTNTGLFEGIEPNLIMAEGYFSKPDENGETSFTGSGARSSVEKADTKDLQTRSIRCSFNGRADFELDDIEMPDRETAVSLCAILPR